MTDLTLSSVLAGACSYLLGSLNGALITSGLVYREDIRKKGSHNAGLTNFQRCYGLKWAWLVVLIDVGKAVLAVTLAGKLFSPFHRATAGKLLAMLLCITGHSFPVFFGFSGGKGVLCGVSALITLDWRVGLITLGIFVLTVALTKYVSLGSVLAAALMPLWAKLLGHNIFTVGGLAVCGLFVILKHHANIGRLLSGTENRLYLKKTPETPAKKPAHKKKKKK